MKIKPFLVSSIVFLFVGMAELSAQVEVPTIVGTDLNGKQMTLPKDFKGKKTLLGFALTPKISDQLSSWAQPVYDELIDENSLASLVYDAEVCLVICFNRTNVKFKKRVLSDLRENVLPEFYTNIILSETDFKEISEKMDIQDKMVLNLFTLNEAGKVTARSKGFYSEKKFEYLSDFLEME